jgi:hypothetical protein
VNDGSYSNGPVNGIDAQSIPLFFTEAQLGTTEPGTLALLSVGLAGLASTRRLVRV